MHVLQIQAVDRGFDGATVRHVKGRPTEKHAREQHRMLAHIMKCRGRLVQFIVEDALGVQVKNSRCAEPKRDEKSSNDCFHPCHACSRYVRHHKGTTTQRNTKKNSFIAFRCVFMRLWCLTYASVFTEF